MYNQDGGNANQDMVYRYKPPCCKCKPPSPRKTKKKKKAYELPQLPEAFVSYEPCVHLHFKTELIDRDCLTHQQYLDMLATPKGYRWIGEVDCDNPELEINKKKKKKKPKMIEPIIIRQDAGDFADEFVEDMWDVMSPEITDRLIDFLVNEFGMSTEEAEDFIDCKSAAGKQTVCKKKKSKTIIGLGPRHKWVKEFSDVFAKRIEQYIVSMLLTRRTPRVKRIAEKILEYFCDLTGEKTTLQHPKTKIQRTMVLISDRLALWIEDIMRDIEKPEKKRPIITEEEEVPESDQEQAPQEEEKEKPKEKEPPKKPPKKEEPPKEKKEEPPKKEPKKEEKPPEKDEEPEDKEPEKEEEKEPEKEEEKEPEKEEEKEPEKEEETEPEKEEEKEPEKEEEKEPEKEEEKEPEKVEEKEPEPVEEKPEEEPIKEEEKEPEEEKKEAEVEKEPEEAPVEEEKPTEPEEKEEPKEEQAPPEEETQPTEEKPEEQSEAQPKEDEEALEEKTPEEAEVTAEEEKPIEEEKPAEEEKIEEEPIPTEEEPPEEEPPEEKPEPVEEKPPKKEEPKIISEPETKLYGDILDILKEDIAHTPKDKVTDRQKAVKDAVDRRLDRIIASKEPIEIKQDDIDDATSRVAHWVEQILGATEKPKLPVARKGPGAAFEVKPKTGSTLEVNKLSSGTVARVTAQARGLEIPPRNRKMPSSESPMNLKSAQEWVDWATNIANIADDWGKWLDSTLTDAERQIAEKNNDSPDKDATLWKQWRDQTQNEALKWRVEKERIKDEGQIWNRKIDEKLKHEPEKEMKSTLFPTQ